LLELFLVHFKENNFQQQKIKYWYIMSDSSNSSESRTRKRIQEAKNKARPGIEDLRINYNYIRVIIIWKMYYSLIIKSFC